MAQHIEALASVIRVQVVPLDTLNICMFISSLYF